MRVKILTASNELVLQNKLNKELIDLDCTVMDIKLTINPGYIEPYTAMIMYQQCDEEIE